MAVERVLGCLAALETRRAGRTWPILFAPHVHSSPSLPTNNVWFLPQAAYTNFVPSPAPNPCGVNLIGAFSETTSSGTPSEFRSLRPNSQAAPSMSMTTKLHAEWEV